MKYLKTKSMTYDEWIKSRQRGIGGSDSGAVLGFNKYRTIVDVYYDKVNDEPTKIPDNPRMKAGRKLENLVADWWSEESGLKFRKDNKIRIHTDYPFVIVNLDFVIVKPDDRQTPGVLEIKTCSGYAFKEWIEDGCPLTYFSQAQHELFVTGYEWGEFGLLVDGYDFKRVPFERDDEFIGMMLERYQDFWINNVIPKIPPDPTNTSDILKVHPVTEQGKSIEATDTTFKTYMELKVLKDRIKELENEKSDYEFRLQMAMQDNEILTYGDKPIVTWKSAATFDENAFKVANPETYKDYCISFDKSLLKRECPALYKEYSHMNGSRRFLIK